MSFAAATEATPSSRRAALYAAVKTLSAATGDRSAPVVAPAPATAPAAAPKKKPGKRRELLKKKARKAALRKKRYAGYQKKKWHPT